MLWVMFNQEGQKLYAVDTGNLAHAGTNDYEIYAVFQEVDLRVYNGASLKLYRPDINSSSYCPLAMTPRTDTGDGIVYDGPENPFFTRSLKYQGFYFSFTSPSTILLDMAGLWRAVITLYSAANPNLRNVVGRLAFNVGNGRDSNEPHTVDIDEILENIYAEYTSKLDVSSPNYTKALDSQSDYNWSSGIYHVGDIIYIKNEQKFYGVNESHELEYLNIGSGGGGGEITILELEGTYGTLTSEQYSLVSNGQVIIKLSDRYYRFTENGSGYFDYFCFEGHNEGASTIVISAHRIRIIKSNRGWAYTDNGGRLYNQATINTLLGNKQNTLTFDSVPTIGSLNPVTSDGIKAAINEAISGGTVFKGTVADLTELNAIENPSVGDMYWVASENCYYVYNGTTWSEAGGTVDLSNYATKDEVQNVREVAEGKCKAYVLSYNDTIAFVKTQVTAGTFRNFYLWNTTTQEYEDKTAEVLNGDYDEYVVVNNLFNSTDTQLMTNSNQYLIFRNPANSTNALAFPSISFYMISLGYSGSGTGLIRQLKTGDVFYIMETDVPDRWFSGKYTYSCIFYALESKTDLSGYEVISNKVTSISNSSTNTQYPSAKCVWDNLQNVREVAEGKCRTFVIDYNEQPLTETYFTNGGVVYKADGEEITTWGDFLDYTNPAGWETGTVGIANNYFNSNDDDISIFFQTFLTRFRQYLLTTEKVVFIGLSDGNIGDIFLVKQLNVPDRWISFNSGSVTFSKLETSKVDITNYYTKNADIVPTTNNAYDLGSSSYTFKDLYLSNEIKINGNQLGFSGGFYFNGNVRPYASNTYDLGTSTQKWKDLCLSGSLKDGDSTHDIAIADIQRKLTFDSTPTENSTNPVTSGGVRAYVLANQNTLPLYKHTITFVKSGSELESLRTYKLIFLSTVSMAFSFDGVTIAAEMGPELVIEPQYQTPSALKPNLGIKVSRSPDGTSLSKIKYSINYISNSSGNVVWNTDAFAESNGDTMNDVVTTIQLS